MLFRSKTDYKEIKLEKGTIFEYSFGEVKLLVYRTNDNAQSPDPFLIRLLNLTET